MSDLARSKALKFTLGDDAGDLGYEGGWVNKKEDRGGETFRGVSRVKHPNNPIWPILDGMKTWPEFPACANYDAKLYVMVRDFYVAEFWNPIHGDELPEKLAVAVFDAAIHHGPERAVKLAQIALGVTVDGDVGAKTVKAAHAAGERGVVRFLAQRTKFLHSIMDADPTQEVWALNWFIRMFLLANVVLEGARVDFGEEDPPAGDPVPAS